MAPSIEIEVTSKPEEKKKRQAEPPVLEPRKAVNGTPSVKVKLAARPEEGTFKSSMLEYHRMKSSSRLMDALISLLVNTTILVVPVFAGLYYTDTLDLKQYASTFLIAPPPPPPPPPAPVATAIRVVPPHRVFVNAGKLVAPSVVPKDIAMLKEAPLPPDVYSEGGVPGGVFGGVAGGTIGGVIGGVKSAAPAVPVAVKEKPRAPVRVGGRVKQPRLINRVDPIYPSLAVQTHMEGDVMIEAIIDERGDVVEMKVVSGPPLLIQSALNAVRQWKYEPTYLNEQPVAVQLNVTVAFKLAR